ncbi:MAG: hypothetical protein BIFFINMI_03795 [Phycisphaerae bacterium]|nr:hypothetical protein [Phycisphaerae bacterium]
MAVCQALGIRLGDLFPSKPKPMASSRGRIVATYDYRDAAGELRFQVVRFEPKDFRQRRPDGSGGWTWDLAGVGRVLYRLPELLAADPSVPVFVAEGEKDADNLASIGLVATTNPGGAGKWSKLSDDSALHGRRVVILPDKDTPGRRHAEDVAGRLHGKAAEVRLVELPGDGKDASDWIESLDSRTPEELRDMLLAMVEAAPLWRPPTPQPSSTPQAVPADRPNILIDTEEHRVVSETVAALSADQDVFRRGAVLVRVIRERQPDDGILRVAGSATISTLPAANLRERLTRIATFTKLNRKGDEIPTHPATWLVSAIDARGEWPGIRPLLAVSDAPVLRHDGSVWQTAGYDAATGVLFEPDGAFPPIAEEPTIDHARRAAAALDEIVCDFPFEADEHRGAWLAGVLTPLARFAFTGPSPLFLIDANVRGAGKGLLAQTIGRIVLGREMPVSSYVHETEEMRKKITSIAIAGDRMILFDNLDGVFGNDVLDRALTSTRWKDRILGRSEEIELPLAPAWYATGNNVQVAGDTARRIIHIRLDVLAERPEERTGFRHPNLVAWIVANRGRLIAAAITILSAYIKAGRPCQNLTPYGSFEGWSDLVRQAVVWAGLDDPCLTRTRLTEASDTTADTLSQLISAWRLYDPFGRGVIVSEMLATLYPGQRDFTSSEQANIAMRAALENMVGCPPGKPPTPRQVGNKLRYFRRRVVGGVYLDVDAGESRRNGAVWKLYGLEGGES